MHQFTGAPAIDMGPHPYPTFTTTVAASPTSSTRDSRRSSVSSIKTTSTSRSSCSIPDNFVLPNLEHHPPCPKERNDNNINRGPSTNYSALRARRSIHAPPSSSIYYQGLAYRTNKNPNQDLIDALDLTAFSPYHHEGPYDAVSRVRNQILERSPLQALSDLRSPVTDQTGSREDSTNVLNSQHRRPRQTLAPPGIVDRDGHYNDEDPGTNLLYDSLALQGRKFTKEDFENERFHHYPCAVAIKDAHEKLINYARRRRQKSRRREST